MADRVVFVLVKTHKVGISEVIGVYYDLHLAEAAKAEQAGDRSRLDITMSIIVGDE